MAACMVVDMTVDVDSGMVTDTGTAGFVDGGHAHCGNQRLSYLAKNRARVCASCSYLAKTGPGMCVVVYLAKRGAHVVYMHMLSLIHI